jgi:vacuolar-type H+-ATPase subunit C/Vma6
MSPGWEDLVARVRGASGHLLGRERLVELGRARDLVHLVTMLEESYGKSLGVAPGASPADAELAVRRLAAAHLATLARWGLQRSRNLTPYFLDEDRRSIRSLVRGAAADSPVDARLAGLVPTPTLPERALRELARQRTPAEIAALLSAWNHPFGSPLLGATRTPNPDLLRIDVVLNETWSRESAAAIRRAPRGHDTRSGLAGFVSDTADTENALTALQLAGQRTSIAPDTLFMPNGKSLPREVFREVAGSAGVAAGLAILSRAFHDTPMAPAFEGPQRNVEDRLLAARLRVALQDSFRFPLGAAPVILFVLRLRAEIRDLCLIIWRLATGAPPPGAPELLSPA